MIIIAVDDEKIALDGLITAINRAVPGETVNGFRRGKEAISFVENNNCDVAFLDIEMREMNGFELAKRIKLQNPNVNIIFTTGYSEYMTDAFAMHASGYVMKPVTAEKIKMELDDLRHPVAKINDKHISVQTFGNFEVFVDGKPVQFQYNKTKELLAYLIDRHGSLCANSEIMAILWEDEIRNSYLKNLKSDLLATFSHLGIEDIIVRQRGMIGVVPEKISCDYYDWLSGSAKAINAYHGEYMTQYSWGEMTLGSLEA